MLKLQLTPRPGEEKCREEMISRERKVIGKWGSGNLLYWGAVRMI